MEASSKMALPRISYNFNFMIKSFFKKLLTNKQNNTSAFKKEYEFGVIENEFWQIHELCKQYTMTSDERMYSLYKAVKYIALSGIKGDFVECGVWKGGSAMIIASTLELCGINDRKIILYDTFEGMSEPSEYDKKNAPTSNVDTIQEFWKKSQNGNINQWCYSSIEEVKSNLLKTSYPFDMFELVKGKVEDTIPAIIPDNISLLRLDTDWYESTKHELIHLYPILSIKGILIIDDYGSWAGAKKAVDEYFDNIPLLFNRVDSTGRIAIKL